MSDQLTLGHRRRNTECLDHDGRPSQWWVLWKRWKMGINFIFFLVCYPMPCLFWHKISHPVHVAPDRFHCLSIHKHYDHNFLCCDYLVTALPLESMLIESSLCTKSHVVQKTITIKLIVHGVVSRGPVERKCPNKMDRGTKSKLKLMVQKKKQSVGAGAQWIPNKFNWA